MTINIRDMDHDGLKDVLVSDPFGQNLIEDHPAQSGFHPLAVVILHLTNMDGSVQVDKVGRVGDASLIKVIESAADSRAVFPDLGQVEAAHNHVQSGRHQRVPRGGR